jgi:hypothetical protein
MYDSFSEGGVYYGRATLVLIGVVALTLLTTIL